MGFFSKLEGRMDLLNTILCLGLDPRVEQVDKFAKTDEFRRLFLENVKNNDRSYKKEESSTYVRLKLYCLHILDSTLDHVCSVKPNFAFFLAHATEGVQVLLEVCQYLRERDVPVLLDCKLGDIGSTTDYYKKFVFGQLKADACTVNSFMGTDVLRSFCTDSGGNFVNDVFVLAKCSNPSSRELQSALFKDDVPLYMRLIDQTESLGHKFGYVVGSNCVDAIKRIREKYDSYLLVPGVGSQGGDLEQTIKYGLNKDKRGLLVPISRAITDTDVSSIIGSQYLL
ncbi:orotidine 5'-phosphate decarboxylase [Theileria orientalis strain Shintoku]|uniref:Orotidine 5'-phosphate decarboxylase n=1 Tax=Theileria orientalis strain Shintoku TaxID=869250 RepID=J4CCL9_THEOR|nr:orotidine 5'-phosphate decarboxylase [Theileria orientalis strain Shintoku]PVC49555.1 orotidine 5'-phosphate decarboxylase [Theileria orientalis]BAM39622.1 orotidine 5'-phosphate decarboxylase [Theileria orientalis strain Shintoku]|eukprot:XP_009689923.1 orotidine 5'-phosphate decarboxylase [Theileria orientalis strain Shintoku]